MDVDHGDAKLSKEFPFDFGGSNEEERRTQAFGHVLELVSISVFHPVFTLVTHLDQCHGFKI